jgi:hypothetical protein
VAVEQEVVGVEEVVVVVVAGRGGSHEAPSDDGSAAGVVAVALATSAAAVVLWSAWWRGVEATVTQVEACPVIRAVNPRYPRYAQPVRRDPTAALTMHPERRTQALSVGVMGPNYVPEVTAAAAVVAGLRADVEVEGQGEGASAGHASGGGLMAAAASAAAAAASGVAWRPSG